jgi:chromosome segregation ATPase
MMKYRSMLLNAEDMHNRKITEDSDTQELIANHPTVTLLTERNKDLEQRLLEAQKQFAELQLNHEQIELDAMRLYEAIELLKAKYATVLEEKKQLATELIKKEEEKLELARGIVELKIAQSQSSEKAEKELFEATSNMLAMKNEIYEMDGREQLLKVQLAEVQEKYDETSAMFERERENGIALKSELQEVRQQLERAEGRNVEIGKSLPSLVCVPWSDSGSPVQGLSW